jgi:ketosteroid isomerase-like protein
MDDKAGRSALEKLVVDFTEAFNREDIDEVMGYFAPDAIYDEFNGARHRGTSEIRKAFEPQFAGAFGRMRFHTEDMFLDVPAQKALIRWTLTLEEPHRAGAYRGLDILHWRDGRLVEKHTYCKAKVPLIRKRTEMQAEGSWPDGQTA